MSNPGEKILVRGVNWLGDAIMTTPALLRLRELRPTARISLLTHQKIASLWKHFPAIDEVVSFRDEESVWQVGRRLREFAFDQALIFPNSPRSALESWWARIPSRVGYARSWRNWFLTDRVSSRPGVVKMQKKTPYEVTVLVKKHPLGKRQSYPESSHHLFDYLHLIGHLGGNPAPLAPRISVAPEEESDFRQRYLSEAWSGSSIILGLNAGAEYGPAKRWPLERFIEAALHIQKATHGRVMIFGGKADTELANAIQGELQKMVLMPNAVVNVAGRTDLRDLCVGLKLCTAVLTNDTGPMHVAAAVGTRVIVPFGSTSPELTGPGLPGERRHHLLLGQAPCAPCFLRECPIDFRCMKDVSVHAVVDEVLKAVS